MSMEERMHVTELCREHWPGVIVNNISSASHADVLRYVDHSQRLVKEVGVGCTSFINHRESDVPRRSNGAATLRLSRTTVKVLQHSTQSPLAG